MNDIYSQYTASFGPNIEKRVRHKLPPLCSVVVPALQLVHVVELLVGAIDPAAHARQLDAPSFRCTDK
jgi:hypothetical protein